MKALFATAAFMIIFAAAHAQPVSTPTLSWTSVTSDDPVTVEGNVYVPENAHRIWSIQRASNIASVSYRFEVRAGDQWAEDARSGENKERSELDGYKTRWGSGISIWGAYSFLIEAGPTYHSDWNAIAQMHGSSVRPFHVHFNGEIFAIRSERLAGGRTVESDRYSGRMSRNSWHAVVFHLIQSSGKGGALEFWLDGAKIVSYSGPIGDDGNRAYWKFGVYRGYGPIQQPFAIEYANVEVGTVDLTARIAHSLPIR